MFEYKVVPLIGVVNPDKEKILNELGTKGWELVSVSDHRAYLIKHTFENDEDYGDDIFDDMPAFENIFSPLERLFGKLTNWVLGDD